VWCSTIYFCFSFLVFFFGVATAVVQQKHVCIIYLRVQFLKQCQKSKKVGKMSISRSHFFTVSFSFEFFIKISVYFLVMRFIFHFLINRAELLLVGFVSKKFSPRVQHVLFQRKN